MAGNVIIILLKQQYLKQEITSTDSERARDVQLQHTNTDGLC